MGNPELSYSIFLSHMLGSLRDDHRAANPECLKTRKQIPKIMAPAFIFLLSIIVFFSICPLLWVPGLSFPFLDNTFFQTQNLRLSHKLGLQGLRHSKEDTRYQLHAKMWAGEHRLSPVTQSTVVTHQPFWASGTGRSHMGVLHLGLFKWNHVARVLKANGHIWKKQRRISNSIQSGIILLLLILLCWLKEDICPS